MLIKSKYQMSEYLKGKSHYTKSIIVGSETVHCIVVKRLFGLIVEKWFYAESSAYWVKA